MYGGEGLGGLRVRMALSNAWRAQCVSGRVFGPRRSFYSSVIEIVFITPQICTGVQDADRSEALCQLLVNQVQARMSQCLPISNVSRMTRSNQHRRLTCDVDSYS